MGSTEKQANRTVGFAASFHSDEKVTEVVGVGVRQKPVTWHIHNDLSTLCQVEAYVSAMKLQQVTLTRRMCRFHCEAGTTLTIADYGDACMSSFNML